MADPERESRLYSRIRRTLSEGGAIWFVSQSYPNPLPEETMPAPPTLSAQPGGDDYVRFRSYWERAIIFRLYSCCRPVEWPLFWNGPVWDEERLVLTRWRPEAGRAQN